MDETTEVLDPGQVEALKLEYDRLRGLYPSGPRDPDEDPDDWWQEDGDREE